jgi:hypothetical protein
MKELFNLPAPKYRVADRQSKEESPKKLLKTRSRKKFQSSAPDVANDEI